MGVILAGRMDVVAIGNFLQWRSFFLFCPWALSPSQLFANVASAEPPEPGVRGSRNVGEALAPRSRFGHSLANHSQNLVSYLCVHSRAGRFVVHARLGIVVGKSGLFGGLRDTTTVDI